MKENGAKGRIEKYIVSRLWNSRMKGETEYISRERLLKEIQKYFMKDGRSLKDDPDSQELFIRLIERSRNKVRKAWSKLRKREKEWAKALGITHDQVHELIIKGVLNNKADVKKARIILDVVLPEK
ncbi:MAG: hypothetical protein QM300_11535 [Pseudomonadota bacterium]|jgi:endonuclease III|nr:hypothetical protein [Pseudomonadota bacterium]